MTPRKVRGPKQKHKTRYPVRKIAKPCSNHLIMGASVLVNAQATLAVDVD